MQAVVVWRHRRARNCRPVVYNAWNLAQDRAFHRQQTQTEKEPVMGAIADKVKGATNEAIGKGKQAVGRATDNPRLEGEGAAQEVKGKIQTATGKAKDAVKDAVDRL
jgi:uncharacterized protein YjbJ (UPF0337 family)